MRICAYLSIERAPNVNFRDPEDLFHEILLEHDQLRLLARLKFFTRKCSGRIMRSLQNQFICHSKHRHCSPDAQSRSANSLQSTSEYKFFVLNCRTFFFDMNVMFYLRRRQLESYYILMRMTLLVSMLYRRCTNWIQFEWLANINASIPHRYHQSRTRSLVFIKY